jgi:ABC-type polysaccharide/polyol phosphate export permease
MIGGRLLAALTVPSPITAIPVWDAAGVTLVAAWLWWAMLLALGWRGAYWLRRHQAHQPSNEDSMTAPGQSPGLLGAVTRHRTLLRLLVQRDLKLKYRGSLVGFAWSLANPIVMTATYTVAFTYLWPQRVEGFVFQLLLGVLAWTFFSQSVSMATGAIVDSGSLVRSIYFPRVILPLATVSFTAIQYLLALGVLLPLMFVVYGTVPGLPILLLPAALVLVGTFVFGASLLMAASTVVYRDVRHLLDITLQVLFWATPILYTPSAWPAARPLLELSPLAPFITLTRALTHGAAWPSPETWAIAAAYAGLALITGLWVFFREEARFAE